MHPRIGAEAVIALANMLVNCGMLAGSLVAMGLATAGFAARETFLGAAVVLAAGTLWSLWVVPDAFLRFVLILLAGTLYRLRVVGRSNVPMQGPALLTPNHVSFADGLFVIAAIDRPIRFVVYAEYFKRPLIGRFLRTMGAIPIAASGGPQDDPRSVSRGRHEPSITGELVCIFPEGQITRTGMTLPFQRGMERIVKGRDVPIIPVHIDRATASIFSPMQTRRLPERIPLPVTISFGDPLPAIARSGRDPAGHRAISIRKPGIIARRIGARSTTSSSARLAVILSGWPGRPDHAPLSNLKALAGAIALARALRPHWQGQEAVGIMLPTSVAGALVEPGRGAFRTGRGQSRTSPRARRR